MIFLFGLFPNSGSWEHSFCSIFICRADTIITSDSVNIHLKYRHELDERWFKWDAKYEMDFEKEIHDLKKVVISWNLRIKKWKSFVLFQRIRELEWIDSIWSTHIHQRLRYGNVILWCFVCFRIEANYVWICRFLVYQFLRIYFWILEKNNKLIKLLCNR